MRKKEEKEKRRKTLSPFLFPPFQGLGWAREEKSLYNLGRGQTPPPLLKKFFSRPPLPPFLTEMRRLPTKFLMSCLSNVFDHYWDVWFFNVFVKEKNCSANLFSLSLDAWLILLHSFFLCPSPSVFTGGRRLVGKEEEKRRAFVCRPLASLWFRSEVTEGKAHKKVRVEGNWTKDKTSFI